MKHLTKCKVILFFELPTRIGFLSRVIEFEVVPRLEDKLSFPQMREFEVYKVEHEFTENHDLISGKLLVFAACRRLNNRGVNEGTREQEAFDAFLSTGDWEEIATMGSEQ